MINAIAIDDENHCLETLALLLQQYCPEVNPLGFYKSAAQGMEAIRQLKPDLIFLDVEMPNMNGFTMLEHLEEISFAIIFTTSYDQYAIRAIKYSALDYLLKPIDPAELSAAVRKFDRQPSSSYNAQIRHLLEQVNGKNAAFSKLAVPTAEGFEFIPIDTLIRCEANDNYTHFYLRNGKKIIASRTLKETEDQLKPFMHFARVHHSFLVNLNEVAKYIRGEGGHLIMSDGSTVPVSRSRKESLLKLF
ncbi:MAG: LytTR family DNA-binding domain-containing protein [Chitinophagaceae bacterium]